MTEQDFIDRAMELEKYLDRLVDINARVGLTEFIEKTVKLNLDLAEIVKIRR